MEFRSRLMLTQPSSSVDFSQFLIQNKELANEVDKDIEENEELLFDKLLVLYNKDLGGLEDKVVILKTGRMIMTYGLIIRRYSIVLYWVILTKILVRRSLL